MALKAQVQRETQKKRSARYLLLKSKAWVNRENSNSTYQASQLRQPSENRFKAQQKLITIEAH